MIVKLHDGTEGELMVAVLHAEDSFEYRATIVVVRGDDVVSVLWEDNETHAALEASRSADRAVMLAGLCRWPEDGAGRLDLSPWVRERLGCNDTAPAIARDPRWW